MEGRTEEKLDLGPLDAFLAVEYQRCTIPSEVLDEVRILKALLMDPPQQFVEDGTMKTLESWAREAASVISSYDLEKMEREMALELADKVHSILGDISDWMTGNHLDRTGQVSFIDYFLQNLDELVIGKVENEKQRKMDVAPFDALLEHLDSRFMLSSTKEVLRDILLRSKQLFEECPDMWYEYAITVSLFKLFWLGENGETVIFNELMETETGRDFLDAVNALLEFLDEFPRSFLCVKEDLAVIERAAKWLGLVNAFFMDPPQQLVEDGTLKEIDLLAIDPKSITFSFDLLELEGTMTLYTLKMQVRGVDHLVSTLEMQLRSVDHLVSRWVYPTRRIYDRKPKPSRIYYPRAGQFGIVDHLVEYLEQLVKAKPDSVGLLKYYILGLQRKLQGLNCLLMGNSSLRKEEAYQKDLVQSITNLAYEAEYAIDSVLVRDIPIWYCMFWLEDILNEIKSSERAIEMESGRVQSIIRSIIDFEPIELKIIPIVNSTNISGYQLREVFRHDDVKRNFPICTWCLVSFYKERKKEVFL